MKPSAAVVLGRPELRYLDDVIVESLRREGFCGPVSRRDAHALAHDVLSDQRIDEQLELLSRSTPLQGRRILEVGSGWGGLVVRGRVAYGLEIFGLEPSRAEFSSAWTVSRALLQAFSVPDHVIVNGRGEAMPFADASFDVVYSTNVLEHVDDPIAVLNESLRVLRPGGVLQMVVPNYGSWWEGHYGVFWLPHLTPALARIYVRLLGRDPSYLRGLRFISLGTLRRWARTKADTAVVLGWGEDVFAERLRTIEFQPWAALGKVRTAAHWLRRAGLTDAFIAMSRWFGWVTPIVLTLRKRG